MNAPVEQQPLVKPAQAAQFARRRAPIDAVFAQVLEQSCHVGLARRQQQDVTAFEKLGKDAQIAQIGFAGEGAKSFLHAKIVAVILQKRKLVLAAHINDYPRAELARELVQPITVPRSLRHQHQQYDLCNDVVDVVGVLDPTSQNRDVGHPDLVAG